MVLGISSMMIGGAMVWFDSKKSSDFYDQMRQVESRIREAQSENMSSLVPGYDSTPGSPCNQLDRSGCIIKGGEQVYGTAVSIAVTAPNTGSPRLRVYNLKRTTPVGYPGQEQSEGVESYSSRDVVLPANLRFEGYKIFSPSGGVCNAGSAYYRALPYQEGGDGDDFTGTNAESLVVFKKVTGAYSAFWRNNGPITWLTGTTKISYPTWANANTYSNPGLRGNYGDADYQYSSPPTPAQLAQNLVSEPCAVLWRFGSVERKAGAPSEPRFTAEINYNFVDGTTKLVTR